MKFSSWLAEQVRLHRYADPDFEGCDCSTGMSELGAWVFTCKNCMELGIKKMLQTEDRLEQIALQLEVDGIVESSTPPKGWA